MRKFLMFFLLTTVAVAPTAAMAQRDDLAVRGGERGMQRSGGDNNGGWRGQRAQRPAQAPQPQVQQQAPAPQAQPQYSERRGNWPSRSAVRTPDTMNTSPAEPRRWEGRREGERRVEGRDNDGQRRYGWNRGGNGQPATPPVIAVPQQPRQDWNADQRERWANRNRNPDSRNSGNNRWDGNRRDGDRDRWDNKNRRDRDGRRYAYRTPTGRDDSNWHNRSWYDNDSRFDRWNNDWRRDRRYDWRSYRSHNRDFYRLPRYSHPYGYSYGYRRFSIGIFLDNLFYSDRYWINDPYEYRLPPAYGPYRWVRYYDDVLLVDLRNGRVVDVIYHFFD
jgi:hypothetical protein